jgi:uncharacterized protein YdaU (DUF1376 family)
MRFYDRNIGDWRAATLHLSAIEECIYSRLVDSYYLDEAPLPADIRKCYRLARAGSKEEREAVAIVLDEFFDLQADGYHQKRCDEELARYHDKLRFASEAANRRWERERAAHANASSGNADASQEHADASAANHADASKNDATRAGNANHQPPTTNHERSKSKTTNTSGPGKTGNGKAPHWQVPSLDDEAGLTECAASFGIDATRWPGTWQELQAKLIELQKAKNREQRLQRAQR